MLRLRPLAWSGVRRGAQDGTSDVRRGAQDGTSDVRCGAQVQLPAWQSNSTSSAMALIEPARLSTAGAGDARRGRGARARQTQRFTPLGSVSCLNKPLRSTTRRIAPFDSPETAHCGDL